MKKVLRKGTCMTPECGKQGIYVRGLCQRCYASAQRFVKQKRITWQELEDAGMVQKKMITGNRVHSHIGHKIEELIVNRIK